MTELVIYHGKCYDGFTAAWVARQAMPDCELFEGFYGEEPPYDKARERHVYVVDFSYPREHMEKLNAYTGMTGSLTVLDHHKTAREACIGLPFCEFDMERSGAGMTWDYFMDPPRPWLVDRVEDRDLWRFAKSSTKEAHAYLTSLPMTMRMWDLAMSEDPARIIEQGAAIRRSIDQYCEKAAQEARLIDIDGLHVAAVNVPYQNASEMADVLLRDHPACHMSMGYFQRADGKWQYSLRSRTDFDVSEVAKRFGGGGHAQAAGFETATLLPELVAEP